jgi:hypothetical protein
MAKMSVTVRIPVVAAWGAMETVQVYTDLGDGSIDTTAPLLPVRADLFPDTYEVLGYGEEPYGETAYGGEEPTYANNGGYGDQPYGEEADGYGYGTPYIDVVVMVDQGFGTWKFAAEAYNAAGMAQTDPLDEFTQFVSGEQPTPLSSFTLDSYDSGTDRFTFVFAL